MTDRDDSEPCQLTRGFTPDSCSTSVILNECNPSMIANTDSEEDYETSSEGPRSPRPAVNQSTTNFTESLDDNTVPESDQSLLADSSRFPENGSSRKNDPSASYTVIGVAESPRKDVASKNPSGEDLETRSSNSLTEIQKSASGLEELEARRTEYSVAPRVESDANKSESLPVITIATPWGSYEYPAEVRVPAERLVSDSQVDIKDKMRVIAACMDGCSSLATSRGKFLDELDQLQCSSYPAEVGKDDRYSLKEFSKVDNSWVYSRPETPRTPKLITVTSPKVFSEASNVLPIIRNPDLIGSDYIFPAFSPSGTSVQLSVNDHAGTLSSSFYHLHDQCEESPRNLTPKKSNFDPLSRIEGELAPLQNELSEIRGKVRALNLDYNLSCIEGVGKFPKTISWMTADHPSSHKQNVMGNYQGYHQEQNTAFGPSNAIGVLNFGRNNEPKYRYPFGDQSFSASGYSYNDTKKVDNESKTAELIANKIASHPDVSNAQVFRSEDCEPEVKRISDGSPRVTDRNLSPIYVCTSTPSIQITKGEIIVSQVESEDDTESSSCDKNTTKSPEIRLPDFSEKICIVPIAFLDGMPDPPAEPVFSFAQEKIPDLDGFGRGHKVFRIEHPDASNSQRRSESERVSSSFSGTVLTVDCETEESLSARKEEDDSSISVQENSPRASYRIAGSNSPQKSSCSHNSTFNTNGRKNQGRTYIRGLISGPEDFL